VENQERAQTDIPNVNTSQLPAGTNVNTKMPSGKDVHPSVAKHDHVFHVENGN